MKNIFDYIKWIFIYGKIGFNVYWKIWFFVWKYVWNFIRIVYFIFEFILMINILGIYNYM